MSDNMILVINSGSSSVKMALIDMQSGHTQTQTMTECQGNVSETVRRMLEALFEREDKSRIAAVGHRVVHGGERFIKPTLLDEHIINEIEALSYLAPLHNPANLQAIREAMQQLPDIAHIAVFDTAFHHAMPPRASLYAVPYRWYKEHGVRRYGFHGSSHHYVGQEAAKRLGRSFQQCRLLTAHLGNGCSAAAIADGVSVDTTMGLTPLEGLVMGSRSGDVDPGLHQFIARQSGESLERITDILNRQSGLLGLSGLSNDMRTLLQAAASGHERAALAIEIFCYRLAKSLAALSVALGHIDGIVFTGGMGEHASLIRSKTVQHLSIFGARLDEQRNNTDGKASNGFISMSEAALPILVISTHEESMIAHYVNDVLHAEGLHGNNLFHAQENNA